MNHPTHPWTRPPHAQYGVGYSSPYGTDTVVARFHTTIHDADLLIKPEPTIMAHPVGFRVLHPSAAAVLQGAMIAGMPQNLGPIPLAAFVDPAPIAWAVFVNLRPLELRFAGEGDVTFELALRFRDGAGDTLDTALTYGYASENKWHSALICQPDAAWRMMG